MRESSISLTLTTLDFSIEKRRLKREKRKGKREKRKEKTRFLSCKVVFTFEFFSVFQVVELIVKIVKTYIKCQ